MDVKKIIGLLIIGLCVFAGCAKHALVTYEQVEKTNMVEVTLVSGEKVVGTIYKVDPHQLSLLRKDRKTRVIAKSSVRMIKRKPPIYDDFGKGISEEEIQSVQTSRNTLIYGIGGGALSFGTSFFVGSLVSHSMEENGGTVLAASTVVGGGLGTFLFIRAGKKMDHRDAIERIQEKRRFTEVKEEKDKEKTPDEIRKQLEREKERQEELRKQREKLLKELKVKKEKKKEGKEKE